MSDWWTGIAPAEITVPCAGEDHRVRWEQGQLRACDHGDVDDERTLATLGGTAFECVELVGAWQRHRHDLRALVVGPRGGSDEIHVDPDDPRSGGVRRSRPRRRGGGNTVSSVVVGSGASSAGAGSSAHRGSAAPRCRAGRPQDLIALVGLGGGFGERLVATVAAEWTARLREGRPEVAEALPRLHAALYGRVFAALRSWLGEPQLSLELEMTGDQHPRSLTRVDRAVHAQLPFAWLVDVWSRDLTTVQGRFCLDAQAPSRPTVSGGSWRRSHPTCARPSGSSCGSAPPRGRASPGLLSRRRRRPRRRAGQLPFGAARSPPPERRRFTDAIRSAGGGGRRLRGLTIGVRSRSSLARSGSVHGDSDTGPSPRSSSFWSSVKPGPCGAELDDPARRLRVAAVEEVVVEDLR